MSKSNDPLAEFFSPNPSVVIKNNTIIDKLKNKTPQEICNLLPQIIKDARCHAKPHNPSPIAFILENLQLEKEYLPQIIKEIYTIEHERHLPIFIGLINAHILNLAQEQDKKVFQEIVTTIFNKDIFEEILTKTTKINQPQKEEIRQKRAELSQGQFAAFPEVKKTQSPSTSPSVARISEVAPLIKRLKEKWHQEQG